MKMMSGVFVASMAAASATAVSASSSYSSSDFFCTAKTRASKEGSVSRNDRDSSAPEKPTATDKFTPKFDGLRFIETLVTAHR